MSAHNQRDRQDTDRSAVPTVADNLQSLMTAQRVPLLLLGQSTVLSSPASTCCPR